MSQVGRGGPGDGQPSVSSDQSVTAAAATLNSYASTFRNINTLNGYGYEAAAAAAAAAAWVGRFDPSATSLGRLDPASASFPAGLAASQAAVFRRSGKLYKLHPHLETYKASESRCCCGLRVFVVATS